MSVCSLLSLNHHKLKGWGDVDDRPPMQNKKQYCMTPIFCFTLTAQHHSARLHLSSCCDSWLKVISFSLSVHMSSNTPMLEERFEHSSSKRSLSPMPASPPPSTPWLPEGVPLPTPVTPDSARAWVVSRCKGPLPNKYTSSILIIIILP